MNIESIIFIIVLIISVILHEVAHGYMADRLGDPTPRLAGRLSLNPLVHIDWLGSVVLPLFLVISGSPFLIGWAKPVPFNPYNLSSKRWGGLLVAIAGPITNLMLALLGALALHFAGFGQGGIYLLQSLIITNIALAIFNLVPIPPLDGHHILFALIPERFNAFKLALKKYSLAILVAFIIFGWQLIEPIIMYIARLLIIG
ncbi:MAG: Zn-dependent protease [Crocinitomicaceae bacterium]|jgi:Zn-dependent protease